MYMCVCVWGGRGGVGVHGCICVCTCVHDVAGGVGGCMSAHVCSLS